MKRFFTKSREVFNGWDMQDAAWARLLVTNTQMAHEYVSVSSSCSFGWDSVRYSVAAGMRTPLTWLTLGILSLAIFSGSGSFTTMHTPGLPPPGTLGWCLFLPCAISQEAPTPETILLFFCLVVDVLFVHWIPPERRLHCPSAFYNSLISPVGRGLLCSVGVSGSAWQNLPPLTSEFL